MMTYLNHTLHQVLLRNSIFAVDDLFHDVRQHTLFIITTTNTSEGELDLI